MEQPGGSDQGEGQREAVLELHVQPARGPQGPGQVRREAGQLQVRVAEVIARMNVYEILYVP